MGRVIILAVHEMFDGSVKRKSNNAYSGVTGFLKFKQSILSIVLWTVHLDALSAISTVFFFKAE